MIGTTMTTIMLTDMVEDIQEEGILMRAINVQLQFPIKTSDPQPQGHLVVVGIVGMILMSQANMKLPFEIF